MSEGHEEICSSTMTTSVVGGKIIKYLQSGLKKCTDIVTYCLLAISLLQTQVQLSPLLPSQWLNSLRPRQNRSHFAENIFKCNFLNENIWIPIKISLKFVPIGPINNIPALIQIMAWRRSGDKPLSEPMMVSLPTYICVTRPQWVNGKDL